MVTEGLLVFVVAVLVMCCLLLSSLVPRSFTRTEALGQRTRGGRKRAERTSRVVAAGGGPDRRRLPGGVLRGSARPGGDGLGACAETSPPTKVQTPHPGCLEGNRGGRSGSLRFRCSPPLVYDESPPGIDRAAGTLAVWF